MPAASSRTAVAILGPLAPLAVIVTLAAMTLTSPAHAQPGPTPAPDPASDPASDAAGDPASDPASDAASDPASAPASDAAPAPAPAPLPAAEPARDPSPVKLSFGGYVKVDVIYNSTGRRSGATEFIGAGDPGDFILFPPVIPVGPSDDVGDGGGTNINARETRFWLKAESGTAHGPFKAYIEADFYGFNSSLGDEKFTNSSSLRVRHAYGQLGGFLAGQTWSTFMDLTALPEKIDFGSPAGRVFARQAMIRYTLPLGPGTLDLAAESPEVTLQTDAGAALTRDDNRIPDLVVRYTQDTGALHFAVAAMGRELRADGVLDDLDGDGTPEEAGATTVGLGVMVSARATVAGEDNVRFVGHAGRGLGRYMALGGYPDAILDVADDSLQAVDIFGGILSYQRVWTDAVRSNLALSYSQSITDVDPATINKNLASVHANTMWNPIESTRFGLELIWARRELADANGTDGQLIRVQGAVRYVF